MRGLTKLCHKEIIVFEKRKDANVYKNVNKYPFDDKNVKQFYNSGFSKPLSQKSIELLHENHKDRSNNLTNL